MKKKDKERIDYVERFIDKYTIQCYEILDLLPNLGDMFIETELKKKLGSRLRRKDIICQMVHDREDRFRFCDAVQAVACCINDTAEVAAIQLIVKTYYDEKNNVKKRKHKRNKK